MNNNILLNGARFEEAPNGLINYADDYIGFAQKLATEPAKKARELLREKIASDLFFVLFFIVKPFTEGNESQMNHPFVVNACREIETGPKNFTLDIWAREHVKSTSLTVAETLQFQLVEPEEATALYSYAFKNAKKFLSRIRYIFVNNAGILYDAFPDVCFRDPLKEARQWSIDDGIILKRKASRQEPSISAYGLTEGIPTGMHFKRRVYDDIVTDDIKDSLELMEKIKEKFDSSQNTGTWNGHHRVVGTFYHFNDPLVYIRNKKDPKTGEARYHLRLKPATEDGNINGKLVYLPQSVYDNLKGDKGFYTQQLCNPVPEGTQKLKSEYFQAIKRDKIPKDIYKFILVDQAGDLATNKTSGDSWAILGLGVEPKMDDIGLSSIYLLDAVITPLDESEAIEAISRMYIRMGMVMQLGIEKVGLSATHNAVIKALAAKGRHISIEDKTLVLLRPAGRNKKKFIESSLSWPLNNSKLFYCEDVPHAYIERIKQELDNFPFGFDDALNAFAYIQDILKDYHFPPLHSSPYVVGKMQELGVV